MNRYVLALVFLSSTACQEAAFAPDLDAGAEARSGAADAVVVCHTTGDADHVVGIEVSGNAIDAHLAHGDALASEDGSCESGPCDDAPEGAMFCDGTGFVTCDHGSAVYRDCAPGTECVETDGGILCDWPVGAP